jgi:two-component system OmpR family sensor kinase
MLRSLRSRLFLTYLFVVGLVLALVGASLFLFLLRNPAIRQLEFRRLDFWLNAIEARQGRTLLFSNTERLQESVIRLDRAVRARVLLLDPAGEILADSRPGQDPLPDAVLTDMRDNAGTTRGSYRNDLTSTWLYAATPVTEGQRVVLVSPQPSPRSFFLWGDDLLRPLLQAGLLALLLSALLTWLIARWVAAPLSDMAAASRKVAAGEFDQQIPPRGPDEVRSLAVAFNEMAHKVQSSRQAQRDFVANVSHELKTPLTSIQGFARAILDGTAQSAESQRNAARVIFEESERLRRLVEDLLDLARLDAGQVEFKREAVELGSVIRSVLERLEVKARKRAVEVKDRTADLPRMIADGDRLAQVFLNLVDNAITHAPEGSVVELHGSVEDGWVSIHVDDHGPGIPADKLSRIFERFYQIDQARGGGGERGVGLGLAISREIIQAHGGRIIAQSEVGVGSRFTVQLPIARPDDSTLTHSPFG